MKRIAHKKKMYVRWVARKKFMKAIIKFYADHMAKLTAPKPRKKTHVVFDLDENGKVVVNTTCDFVLDADGNLIYE